MVKLLNKRHLIYWMAETVYLREAAVLTSRTLKHTYSISKTTPTQVHFTNLRPMLTTIA